MRLIDADTLIYKLKKYKIPFNADINEIIITAPTVDAEPVRHGHWIRSSDGYWNECSKCHASIDISTGSCLCNADGNEIEHDWCPHCGAKMDGNK